MPTIRDLLAGTALDALDRELLLGFVLGKDRAFVLSHPNHPLSQEKAASFRKFAARRARHEPLAYILGRKEFYGREFLVNRHTLIPRPETEILVEEALEYLRGVNGNVDVVDLGTGSGNIIITLAQELSGKHYHFFAGDTSLRALNVAKKNAKHISRKKIRFVKSDLLSAFQEKNLLRSSHLVITANLPYVSKKIFRSVGHDVRYEPVSALVSDRHGLAHYEKLLKQVRKYSSHKTITLFLEISPEQAPLLGRYLPKLLPESSLVLLRDLADRERVAVIGKSFS